MERKYFIEQSSGIKSIDFLCAIKHDARAVTLQYLENITQEELDWQPYPAWNFIGALAQHIISLDEYFRINFIEKRKFTQEEKLQYGPALQMGERLGLLKGKSPDELRSQLKTAHENMIAAIRGLTEVQLFERIPKAYDEATGSDLAWILYHSAEDEIHHRGQISILRKIYKTIEKK